MSYNRYNQNFYNRKRRHTEETGYDEENKRFRSDGGQIPIEEELETYLYRVGELNDKNRVIFKSN